MEPVGSLYTKIYLLGLCQLISSGCFFICLTQINVSTVPMPNTAI